MPPRGGRTFSSCANGAGEQGSRQGAGRFNEGAWLACLCHQFHRALRPTVWLVPWGGSRSIFGLRSGGAGTCACGSGEIKRVERRKYVENVGRQRQTGRGRGTLREARCRGSRDWNTRNTCIVLVLVDRNQSGHRRPRNVSHLCHAFPFGVCVCAVDVEWSREQSLEISERGCLTLSLRARCVCRDSCDVSRQS
jgi:hypothetical protein